MKISCLLFLILFVHSVSVCAQVTVVNKKGTVLNVDSSKWALSGTHIYNKNSGNVGIGTTSPAWLLDVQGTSAIGQFKRITGGLDVQAPGFLFTRARGAVGLESNILAGDHLGKIQFRGRLSGSDQDYAALMYKADGITRGNGHFAFTKENLSSEVMVVRTDNGNVGINTSSVFPLARLDVNGYVKLGPADSYADTIATVADRAGMLRYNSSSQLLQYHNNTGWNSVATAATADTTNDGWRDDVANTQVRLAYQSNGSTARTTGTEFVVKDDGRVGIGTDAPTERFHVAFPGFLGAFLGVANFFAPANTTAGNTTMMRLGVSAAARNAAEYRFRYEGAGSTLNSMDFGFFGTGALMSIQSGGNVGIGISAPAYKLHVSGQAHADSTVSAPNYTATVQATATGSSFAWNMNLGANAAWTLSAGANTLTITNAKTGMLGLIRVTNSGTSTITLPAGSKVINGGAGVIPLTQVAAAVDILTFYYDGTNYWWTYGNNYN